MTQQGGKSQCCKRKRGQSRFWINKKGSKHEMRCSTSGIREMKTVEGTTRLPSNLWQTLELETRSNDSWLESRLPGEIPITSDMHWLRATCRQSQPSALPVCTAPKLNISHGAWKNIRAQRERSPHRDGNQLSQLLVKPEEGTGGWAGYSYNILFFIWFPGVQCIF